MNARRYSLQNGARHPKAPHKKPKGCPGVRNTRHLNEAHAGQHRHGEEDLALEAQPICHDVGYTLDDLDDAF